MTVFLDVSDAGTLLARYPHYLASLHARVGKALKTNWDATSPTFHRYALMPPCGFPHLHARRIMPDEDYRPDVQGAATGRRIVTVPEGKDHVSSIRIGASGFLIRRAGDDLHVIHDGGASVSVPVSEGCLDMSMLPRNGQWEVFVNKRHFFSATEALSAPEAAVAVERGALGLIQWQHRTASGTQLRQFGLDGAPPAPEGAATAYDLKKFGYRNEWEQLGNRIYTTLVAAACLSDLADYLETHPKHYAGLGVKRAKLVKTRDDIQAFAQYFVDAFCAWPYWRPCMSRRFDGGDWDWNGWSNGTIPGALAIAAILARRQDDPVVRENFLNKGAAWIRSSQTPRVKGVERFRGARHWPVFSTNHGLVIYYSYFTGARLLGLWSKEDMANQKELAKTLAASLKDGAYLEGLGYLRFALGHGVPHYFLRLKERRKKGWHALQEGERAALAATWHFVRHATSAPDVPFGNFGDNQPTRWGELSFARMLAKIAGAPADQLDATIGPGVAHTDAFSALALALPEASAGAREPAMPENSSSVAIFANAGLVLAHTKERDLSLLFNASRPHRTHNKNNDFGGLVVASKDRILLRASKKKAMQFNNAVCGISNGRIVLYEDPRRYGGHLRHEAGPEGCIASAELVYPRPIRDQTGLYGFRRGVFLFEAAIPILCIASAAQTTTQDAAAFCFDVDQAALAQSGYHLECFSTDGMPLKARVQDDILLFKPTSTRLPGLGWNGPNYMQTMITVLSQQPVSLAPIEGASEGQLTLRSSERDISLDMRDVFRRVLIGGGSDEITSSRKSWLAAAEAFQSGGKE